MKSKFLITIIIVTLVTSVPILSDTYYTDNSRCEYICTGKLRVKGRRDCTAKCLPRTKDSKPTKHLAYKLLYKTREAAIYGAIFWGEKNNTGNRIYECRSKDGYHLTTHSYKYDSQTGRYYDPQKIPAGTIIDENGTDISSQICHRH
jgi:hypothetical protein